MVFKSKTVANTTQEAPGTLHFAKRGQFLDKNDFSSVEGVDLERMRARALLTAEQEKKLMRRVDWHIMPLCALMFLMKNLDATNVRPRNIYAVVWNLTEDRSPTFES
jgi:hypothetical protein